MNPAPAVFVSHGSPITALDSGAYGRALLEFGRRTPARAAVVITGHWEAGPPVRLSSAANPAMIYDFYGFPPELYAVRYPAPGDPELAQRLVTMLQNAGVDATADPKRGYDHGTWVPLRHIYPDAQVPLVQLSLPDIRDPGSLFAIGRALEPLRREGILILGSGGITHNLFLPRPASDGPPQPWAAAFDGWIQEKLAAGDSESLLRYEELAPNPRIAVPTSEHFDPLFVVLGAAGPDYRVETIYEGFQMTHFSMRSFSLT